MTSGRSVLILCLVCALVFLGGCQTDVTVEFGGTAGGGGSGGGSDASDGGSSGDTVEDGPTNEAAHASTRTTDRAGGNGDGNPDGDGSGTTVVVGVVNETDRNVVGPLREAVAWWNARDAEYAAWEANFVVRPDAENPDIVARFADTVDCAGAAPACAPQFNSSDELSRYDAEVKFGLDGIPNRAGLVQSAKHELGHVQGIDHCQPPHWLMGCPGSAEHEGKDFRTRTFPWRSETDLNVYLESADPATRREVRAVLDEYETSSETPANLTFEFVDDPWHAHVVLAVERCADCGYEVNVPSIRGGQSYDDDGDLEFIYWADVDVRTTEDLTRRALRAAFDLLLVPEEGSGGSGG